MGKSIKVRRRAFNNWILLGLVIAVFVSVYGSIVYFTYLASPKENIGGPIHLHITFSIIVDDQVITIPAGIGIAPELWRDRSLNKYGLSAFEAPLHTHDTTGTIHVEANVDRNFTLGDFLRIWGIEFNSTCIMNICAGDEYKLTVLVDGVETTIPFENIVLRDGRSIILVFSKNEQ